MWRQRGQSSNRPGAGTLPLADRGGLRQSRLTRMPRRGVIASGCPSSAKVRTRRAVSRRNALVADGLDLLAVSHHRQEALLVQFQLLQLFSPLLGSPDSVDTDQGFTGVSVRAAMNCCS